MRLLAGGVERIAVARRIVVAKIGAGLHRVGGEPTVAQRQLDNLGGAGHRDLRLLAVAALDLEHQIATELFVHLRRIGRDSGDDIGNRRQRLVIDRDRLGGVLGLRTALGDHGRDDIADVMHLVPSESRARRAVHRPAVAERHRMHDGELAVAGVRPVLGREGEEHAGHCFGDSGVDREDARVSVRTAHERAPRRVRQTDVVDIATLAAQETVILAAAQRLADECLAGRAVVHF